MVDVSRTETDGQQMRIRPALLCCKLASLSVDHASLVDSGSTCNTRASVHLCYQVGTNPDVSAPVQVPQVGAQVPPSAERRARGGGGLCSRVRSLRCALPPCAPSRQIVAHKHAGSMKPYGMALPKVGDRLGARVAWLASSTDAHMCSCTSPARAPLWPAEHPQQQFRGLHVCAAERKGFYDLHGEAALKNGTSDGDGGTKGGFYSFAPSSAEAVFAGFFGTENPFEALEGAKQPLQQTGIQRSTPTCCMW
jgi:hypothetical protein